MYSRKLHKTQMFALLMIYRITEGDTETYIHVSKELAARYIADAECAEFSKLRFWGLIEKKDAEKDDGNPNTGYYRITDAGIDFLKGKTKIFSIARLFNNQFYGYAGEQVSFAECAGNHFDYSELMAS